MVGITRRKYFFLLCFRGCVGHLLPVAHCEVYDGAGGPTWDEPRWPGRFPCPIYGCGVWCAHLGCWARARAIYQRKVANLKKRKQEILGKEPKVAKQTHDSVPSDPPVWCCWANEVFFWIVLTPLLLFIFFGCWWSAFQGMWFEEWFASSCDFGVVNWWVQWAHLWLTGSFLFWLLLTWDERYG